MAVALEGHLVDGGGNGCRVEDLVGVLGPDTGGHQEIAFGTRLKITDTYLGRAFQ
ncbi:MULTISPECIES: hypothetical protein [Rhizobium]|uniref:Uncharacterized protein n=1 Tax=Rhizobium aouanii TaxID=3118145 RepID=A0ABU8CJ39_9HYPH|nr:hypothetical protein [Rhizobium acaciae]MCW1410758.1 hypothetical protein [Rhizobium acaciae]MCW1742943.1 hypothetical protein [Rhizobium acaciae]MCW1750139.1 hypothetical protein [Rhizobium acaciae]